MKKLAPFLLTILIGKEVYHMAKKFKFTKNSSLVKAWVFLIESNQKNFDEVPELLNLREVVAEILGLEPTEEQ